MRARQITMFAATAFMLLSLAGCGDDFNSGMEALKRKDYAAAMRIWEPIANNGDPRAQYALGQLYYDGLGVPKDRALATSLYVRAADQGYTDAQNDLGWTLVTGEVGQPDLPRGASLVKAAAEKGLVRAEVNLGWIYANGKGLKRDPVAAVRWYEKAANTGDRVAEYNLGWMYAEGDGVSKDRVRALELVRKSADQGYPDAQHYLGVLYANGDSVDRDDDRARTLFAKVLANDDSDPGTRELAKHALTELELRAASEAAAQQAEQEHSEQPASTSADAPEEASTSDEADSRSTVDAAPPVNNNTMAESLDAEGFPNGKCYISELANSWAEARKWATDASGSQGWIQMYSVGAYTDRIVFTYFDGLIRRNSQRTFWKDLKTCRKERHEASSS